MNTNSNLRPLFKVVPILILSAALIVFAFAYPMIVNLIPEGSVAPYDGFSFKIINSECVKMYITDTDRADIYVSIGDELILAKDISVVDLEGVGFEPFYHTSYRNSSGGVFSSAKFSRSGKLVRLTVPSNQSVTLSFAAAPNGPVLTLPVDNDVIIEYFGKPKKTRSIPRSNDWR